MCRFTDGNCAMRANDLRIVSIIHIQKRKLSLKSLIIRPHALNCDDLYLGILKKYFYLCKSGHIARSQVQDSVVYCIEKSTNQYLCLTTKSNYYEKN